MGLPILPEQFEGSLRQRDIAIFATLAEAHVHEHTSAVDIRDLEIDGFFDAQAAGVDGGQAGLVAQ